MSPKSLRRVTAFLIFLLCGLGPASAVQSVRITKIGTVSVPPDQVFIPYPKAFFVEWDAVDTNCPQGVYSMSVTVDGVDQVDTDGTGFSGSAQLFQTNFSNDNCQHTIQIKAKFRQSGPPFNCSVPIAGFVYSSPQTMWSTAYRVCTSCTDCSKSTVGNPVDVATGKMFHEMTDLAIQGPIPLQFTRRYDSQSTYNGAMGFGWQHSFLMRVEAAGSGRQVFVDAQGRRVYFSQNATGAPQGTWDENRIEHRSPGWSLP